MSVSIRSYAKVNLYLHVTGKRADGYHEIDTLFYGISLYDILTLNPANEMSITANMAGVPQDENNIIIKVHNILQTEYGLKDNFAVNLHKNIPIGAGLGGGSSNAAAYLRLVNDISALRLSKEKQQNILARVGSDAPFFTELPAAIGKGRGEILTPIKKIPNLHMILINPKIFISTKEIYTNEKLKLTSGSNINIISGSVSFDEIAGSMKNDLQPVAEGLYPEIAELCVSLERAGAKKAIMSGSGSTVFGVFENAEKRDIARKVLTEKYPEYMVIKADKVDGLG